MKVLGDLQKVRVSHDSSREHSGWFLETVTVGNQATGQSWRFPCRGWLDSVQGMSRELFTEAKLTTYETTGQARVSSIILATIFNEARLINLSGKRRILAISRNFTSVTIIAGRSLDGFLTGLLSAIKSLVGHLSPFSSRLLSVGDKPTAFRGTSVLLQRPRYEDKVTDRLVPSHVDRIVRGNLLGIHFL